MVGQAMSIPLLSSLRQLPSLSHKHAHSLRYLTNQCQLSFASPASVVLRGVCDVVLSHWRAAVAWLRHNATKIGQAAPSPLQDVQVPQVPLTCRTRAKQYGPTPNPTSAGQKQGFYNKTHSSFTSSICRLDFCRGHVHVLSYSPSCYVTLSGHARVGYTLS